MKALLIATEHRSVAMTEIGGHEDIAKLIGFDTIESEAVGTDGDRIYFDEKCFLRGTGGRFQVDSLIPISGNAVSRHVRRWIRVARRGDGHRQPAPPDQMALTFDNILSDQLP
jgi:hypothetical protein